MKNNRRDFIKTAVGASMGMIAIGNNAFSSIASNHVHAPLTPLISGKNQSPRIRFSVIGINHPHIYGMVRMLVSSGGELKDFHAKEDDLADEFIRTFPRTKRVSTEAEILEDNAIPLVLSSAISSERAPLGIRVMEHGKDFMVAKPGVAFLPQLAKVRKVQQKTGRIYSINYGRLLNKALLKAKELIRAGAIGKVVQTIGTSPHRLKLQPRPAWFFDRKYFGGILCDLATHEFDSFLFLTGSTSGKIIASQTGNIHHPQYRDFEDFGDAMVQGNRGTGYIRVDWLTPEGLGRYFSGDSRTTILGTDGYIEIRNSIDLGGREGGNHLFLVDHKGTQYFDCNDIEPRYGTQLIDDVVNRTETAMSQTHCFLATELTLLAQKKAVGMAIL